MGRRRNTFALITDEHDILSLELTPCAGFLYRLLLRTAPAGQRQEFELKEEFCEAWDYSLKWAKSALQELVDLNAVEIVRKFSGHGYALIAWHPEHRSAAELAEKRKSEMEASKKQPSNPHSVEPIYREFKRTTNRPTHHPVLKKEREESIGSIIESIEIIPQEETQLEVTPQVEPQIEPELEPQAIEEIKAAGFRLNTALIKIVRATAAEIVLKALQATQQYLTGLKEKKTQLNREPEAVLVAAIKNEWKPLENYSSTKSNPIPEGFNEWYDLARSVLVAQACSIQADLTRQAQGVLCVLNSSDVWEPFDQIRAAYSVKRLRSMWDEREALMKNGVGKSLSLD